MSPLFRLFPVLCACLGLVALPAAGLAADPAPDFELGSVVDDSIGLDWSLPDGQLVHLRIVDHQFRLLFLNEEREIVTPVLERVIVRGEEARNQTNELFLPLEKAAGAPFLTHPRRLYPPFDYWIRLVVPGEQQEDGEAIVLPRERFRQ